MDGAQDARIPVHDEMMRPEFNYLQGLTFRSIEFDAGGTAAFSFVAIRPGTYAFHIGEVEGTINVI